MGGLCSNPYFLLRINDNRRKYMKNIHFNERSNVASVYPASLFEREMEGEVWSVKKEKLFERSEFFSFSGIPDWNSSKSADGSLSFLLPFFFLLPERKK